MSARVSLSSAAERDLAEHAACLGKDNPDVGERFLKAATDTFEGLLTVSATGEVFQSRKSALRGIRIWRVSEFPNHVFAYRSVAEGILIVRVFHAAQDWQRLLEGSTE